MPTLFDLLARAVDVPAPQEIAPDVFKQSDEYPGVPNYDLFQAVDPDLAAIPDPNMSLIDLLLKIERNTRKDETEPVYNVQTFRTTSDANSIILRNPERCKYVSVLSAKGLYVYLGSGRFFPLGKVSNNSLFARTPFLIEALTIDWDSGTPRDITVIFSSEPFTMSEGL